MRDPISVVVPTRDRPEQLDRCLASILASLAPGDELIVVDSASRDPGVSRLAADHGATVIRCDRPGASRARNAGAEAASHAVIAFVDDDIRVAPDWAERLGAALTDPAVGFATGRISVPPEQVGYQRPVAINEGDHPVVLDAGTTDSLGPSANLAIRRRLLLDIGGFDPCLGAGARLPAAEDLDLYDRLFAAGVQGRYEPGALAWHDQWRDRRALLRLDWGYGIGSGARLAKLLRVDRERATFVARTVLWRTDLGGLARAIRRREEFAALTTAVRIVGTIVGLVRAAPLRVQDGLFEPRRER